MADVKKVSQIYERKRTEKNANLTHLEVQVGAALQEVVAHLEGQNKRLAAGIAIAKAIEINFSKDKSAIVVYFNYRSHKTLLTALYQKVATELEKKLKKIVLLLSTRKIHSRWIKENRTQKRPNSRNLTAVYEAILDELLLPGIIVASRTRVRLDGSQYTKISIDKSSQHFLEERVEAIRSVYKRLTTRDIEIDFQKEATFYVLKKGEKK